MKQQTAHVAMGGGENVFEDDTSVVKYRRASSFSESPTSHLYIDCSSAAIGLFYTRPQAFCCREK